jgi:NAD(P)H-dependent FMN reductase
VSPSRPSGTPRRALGAADQSAWHALAWSEIIAGFDSFIFVVPEYNHGIPGVLKNASDYCFWEFQRKPAAFLGYGGTGGVRAVEQLRLICVERSMAPLRSAIHIGRDVYAAVASGRGHFSDFEALQHSASQMLDELAWWTAALSNARKQRPAERTWQESVNSTMVKNGGT